MMGVHGLERREDAGWREGQVMQEPNSDIREDGDRRCIEAGDTCKSLRHGMLREEGPGQTQTWTQAHIHGQSGTQKAAK